MPAFSCSSRHFTHISLSIGSYLELTIFREDFPSVASVNVRFSWVFYFVFICCYKLNSPHNEMLTGPGLFSLGAFRTFRSHDFRHGCLYVESSEGGRGRLKRFVTVVALKFLKISCFFFVLSVSCWNIRFGTISNFRRTNSTRLRENLRNHVHSFRQYSRRQYSRRFSRLHLVDFGKEILRFLYNSVNIGVFSAEAN